MGKHGGGNGGGGVGVGNGGATTSSLLARKPLETGAVASSSLSPSPLLPMAVPHVSPHPSDSSTVSLFDVLSILVLMGMAMACGYEYRKYEYENTLVVNTAAPCACATAPSSSAATMTAFPTPLTPPLSPPASMPNSAPPTGATLQITEETITDVVLSDVQIKHTPAGPDPATGDSTAPREGTEEDGGWMKDPEYETLAQGIKCAFPVVDVATVMDTDVAERLKLPFVLRGATKGWKAHKRWHRDKLLKLYARRTILAGSESSILSAFQFFGLDDKPTLEMVFSSIRNNTQRHVDASSRSPSSVAASAASSETASIAHAEHAVQYSDVFAFDPKIMSTIPEFKEDFTVHPVFHPWDNPGDPTSLSKPMLSIGPTRGGLPFHDHGETWIGLVYGKKRWFVYPPGFNPPMIQWEQPNMLPINEWFKTVYPQLQKFPAPALAAMVGAGDTKFYRPLECVQEPGDIIYLPPHWVHQTMNIGEVVGVGGQRGVPTDDRLRVMETVVARSPFNVMALRSWAQGLAQKGHMIGRDKAAGRQNIADAVSNLRKAVAINSKDIGLRYGLLAFLSANNMQKEWERTMVDTRRMVEDLDRNTISSGTLCEIYGKLFDAFEDFEQKSGTSDYVHLAAPMLDKVLKEFPRCLFALIVKAKSLFTAATGKDLEAVLQRIEKLMPTHETMKDIRRQYRTAYGPNAGVQAP